jgi:UDP-N-acetylmuramate dehydrogenase
MNKKLRDRLTAMVAGHVLFDEPLHRYTSLAVGGSADALVFPQDIETLAALVLFFRQNDCPFLVVGNWTNLLVLDGGYRGAVIGMKNLHRIVWGPEEKDHEMVEAQAGAALSELVRLAAGRALTGMEFCAGIPGSVGGAVIMNAGAYGNEIKDVVSRVTLMDHDGAVMQRLRDELHFGYRKLDITQGTIIINATFHLLRGDRSVIRQRIEDIIHQRKQKHPLDYPSAGSIFKNPTGHAAGRLIEEAGLKGMQLGGAKISDKHGNFIINTGGAKAADILGLIERVRQEVLRQTGIALETEVRIVGENG